MEKTVFDNIIVEQLATVCPKDNVLKRHTRWIAMQTEVPIIHSVHGDWLNENCHIRPSYSQQYLSNQNKN